ncbi:MAG: type I restriction endonuclease, partial [Gammaproteobacteria bacterium]
IAQGPDMAPGESASERDSFADVILVGRLRDAITRLNPTIPESAREDALRKVLRLDNPAFLANNRTFHHMLRDGVEVEYKRPDGSIAGDRVRTSCWWYRMACRRASVRSRPVRSGSRSGAPSMASTTRRRQRWSWRAGARGVRAAAPAHKCVLFTHDATLYSV